MQTYLTDKAAQELSPVISQVPPRQALVDIYYPAAAAAGGSKPTGAVIFAHAFVQPSYSYPAVIKQLQSAGYVVVAPPTERCRCAPDQQCTCRQAVRVVEWLTLPLYL